jgi:putative drug exporter of the RND superfamily
MQRSLSFTGRTAAFSFRHKWRVLGAWLLLIVVAGALSGGLSKVLTNDQKDLSGSDSAQGVSLIKSRFGNQPFIEMLIVRDNNATVDSPQFRDTVQGFASTLRSQKGVYGVQSYYDTSDPQMVSADKHAALTQITLSNNTDTADKDIGAILSSINAQTRPQGYSVNITGDISSNHELNKISENDISRAESLGLPIALVVMVLAFGSLIAAGVPLLLGFASIVLAMGSVALIGHLIGLNFLVTSIITMIGLAVGIDYSLFIMGRYREELSRGHLPADAIAIAADSSGRAVFFSGITVLLALTGMLLVPINVFQSIGIGAMVVVVYAVLASLTLLPAMLSLLGGWVNRLGVPYVTKAHAGNRFWHIVTTRVQKHPWIALVSTVALLGAAALPLTQINLGSSGIDALPHNTQTYQGFMALQRDFPAGRTDPLDVVVSGNVNSASTQQAIARLQNEVSARGDLQWLGVKTNQAGDTALIQIASQQTGTGADAAKLVKDMRTTTIPQAFSGSGDKVYLTGSLPSYQDVKSAMNARIPVVFGFVLGLSFILLLLVFRSIVIPAKAIIMNLLSVGAAYGLLVAVFQKGWLAGPLGFHKTPQIEFWLPLFLFSILFGLSMDYHVFLLSRIREEFNKHGDNTRAVGTGVQQTAGMITSAAIIMVAVFFGFSRGSEVSMQQMGFGLAVAVLIDATIIRSVLVPASMQLLGHLNWYLPSWLEWLPQLHIEGAATEEADREPVLVNAAAD